jgi:hypothetical protein
VYGFLRVGDTVHTKAWLTVQVGVEEPPGGKMFHFSWLHVETKHGAQKQPICQLEPEQKHFRAHIYIAAGDPQGRNLHIVNF